MTEARVAIAEDLVLDFSGLFTGEPPENPETLLVAGDTTIDEPQKPVEGLAGGIEGQQAKKLYQEAQRERDERQRSLEACRAYQENTKRSERLQVEIRKGVKAGEDVYSLFLKAIKAISIMTSNDLYYSQVEADLVAIYGRGLQNKAPLQMELERARERLQRLLEAEQREQPPDSKDRIHRAIEAHRKTIAELEAMIDGAEA